jgi:endoglucanase
MQTQVSSSTVRRFLLGVCFALAASACLTPPGARKGDGPAPTAASKTKATPAPSLGDFSRNSLELVAKLRIGWNLGNCLDAPDGETAWGNPPANQEIFNAAAKAGFKVVRIPVTWSKHLSSGPDYAIEPSWLERVEEVVGYARAAGLYAIINVHHDGADGMQGVAWLNLKDGAGQTTDENNAQVRAQFIAVWKQIAKYFANAGEELIFESMNEVHDGYGKPDPRHFVVVNQLNQEFVNLVRASGGNNGKRHLLIPGYNTNIDHTLEGFKLPSDTTPGRLILSVHYYDPYLFALMAKTHTWGKDSPENDNWGQEDFVIKQFDKLKARYVDKGVPVIIGEYGAVHQEDFQDYRRYYMEYVTKAAVDRGLVPIYWDNGGRNSGGDGFALFDRDDNTVFQPKILAAIMRAATKSYKLEDIAPPASSK